MPTQQETMIKMALDGWNGQIMRTNKLFESLSDEQLANETAPNRNTGMYLLGHLAAVHDGLFPLLGFGEKLKPEMEAIFIETPDKSGLPFPNTQELRQYWNEVNNRLSTHFANLSLDDWFKKHAAISDEDFVKEPHRNRLNVLLNRTMHLANHLGQLTYLGTKSI